MPKPRGQVDGEEVPGPGYRYGTPQVPDCQLAVFLYPEELPALLGVARTHNYQNPLEPTRTFQNLPEPPEPSRTFQNHQNPLEPPEPSKAFQNLQ